MLITRTLFKAIRSAWDKKTCYPLDRGKWNSQVPEKGQCAITALLIHERYGGHIGYNSKYDHYWNILPDGRRIDLTRKQFHDKNIRIRTEAIVTRKEILHTKAAKKFRTPQRYDLLKQRVDTIVG
jgi:hypothetical protein